MADATLSDGTGGTHQKSLTPYQALVRGLSDRLVEAQRPIRVLDAVKWDDGVERAFFAAGARALPPVTPGYYARRPLPFDPEQKRRELRALERDIRRSLGAADAAGRIMARMCREYREVVDLLARRGTPAFGALSARLYGSASERLRAGGPTLADVGRLMTGALDRLAGGETSEREEPTLDAGQAVQLLTRRLTSFFGAAVRVRLSDGIVADAAAGGDYVKIRRDARFTLREVRLLEAHEGWVHLGTALNGFNQPVCTFLAKGPPSATTTQEGLAVLTELLALASHPGRVRRLADRVAAVALAEGGADFLDVYRYYLSAGYAPRASYQHTTRVFRGSLPAGCGPFTKDLCYSKGFVRVYDFVRRSVRRGLLRRVPLLFCGKTNLADVETLDRLVEEGLVAPPRYVPPPFGDLPALSAWVCDASSSPRVSPRARRQEFVRRPGATPARLAAAINEMPSRTGG